MAVLYASAMSERPPLPIVPGAYTYLDPIGSPSEPLQVVLDGGELWARFEGELEGEVLLPVVDMAGEFHGPRGST